MEVKFDTINKNLYAIENNIYFGMRPENILQVSMCINDIITKHIGVLKVKKSDLELIKTLRGQEVSDYDTPLKEYLDELAKKCLPGRLVGISLERNLFNFGYIIDALTIGVNEDLPRYRLFSDLLSHPNEIFEEYESNFPIKFDREKSLEEVRKAYQEISSRLSENCAELFVLGDSRGMAGAIRLTKLKAENDDKIIEAKTDLVEKLKDLINGPSISLDAAEIFEQATELYFNAPSLVRKYGKIITNPNWRTRLFG